MEVLNPLNNRLPGSTLIEASAGTGKTFTITTLFIRLLLEKKLTIDKILVVTFTIAATEELRIKIKQRLDVAIAWLENKPINDDTLVSLLSDYDPTETRLLLSDVAARLDELAVYTIDAMCLKVLKDFAFDSKLPMRMEFIADDNYIRRLVVEDYWRRAIGSKDFVSIEVITLFGSPDKLLAVLQPLLQARNAKVYPQFDKAQVVSLRRELKKQFFHLASLWEQHRVYVGGVLRNDSKVLNANSYRLGSIEKLLVSLEAMFSAEKSPDSLPEKFELVTSTKISSATKKNQQVPEHVFFDECADFYTGFKDYVVQRKAVVLLEARDYVLENIDTYKRDRSLLHFEDLRSRLSDTLAGEDGKSLAEKIRQSWPYAMIDESQDTDPQQNGIFQSVYKGQSDCGLFYIGDPKQAIYSFRGADVFTYMKAAQTFDRTYTLGTNWRSSAKLVKATNTLFTFKPNPFLFENNITFTRVDSAGLADQTPFTVRNQPVTPLQFRTIIDDPENPPSEDLQTRAAVSCAGEIAMLLTQGKSGEAIIGDRRVLASDVAVLVKTHKEGTRIQQALRSLGVKSASNTGTTVFSSAEALPLYTVLLAISRPTADAIRRALVTEIIGFSASDMDELNANEIAWDQRINQFVAYREIWLGKGLMAAVQTLFIELGVVNRVLTYPGGERSLTNLVQISELLQVRSREMSSTEELLSWYEDQLKMQSIEDEQLLRLESDENLVQIVTVHKSKGLEYPIVFIPYAWTIGASGSRTSSDVVSFHDRAGFHAAIDLGSDEQKQHRELQLEENLSESLRLMYVAVTRARYLCVLGLGKVDAVKPLSALSYLLFRDATQTDVSGLKKPDEALVAAEISRLSDSAVDCITHCEAVEPSIIFKDEGSRAVLKNREFSGHIDRNWCITSYTGLQSGEDAGLPDYDFSSQVDSGQSLEPAQITAPESLGAIARLPAGARTGQLLHEILETVDFTDAASIQPRVEQCFERYGSLGGDENWEAVVLKLIDNTLDATLDNHSGLKLRELETKDRINELEFFFTINRLDARRLREVLETDVNYRNTAQGLSFSALNGLMRGFIDMVGRKDGRYFIIDYKSNLLGGHRENYFRDELRKVINAKRYDLQYLIYTVALHRFLKFRLGSGYNYDRDFAGVYYLFVRGMNTDSDAGIWWDKPPVEIVEELDLCFGQELVAHG